jgi:hypothetical protein
MGSPDRESPAGLDATHECARERAQCPALAAIARLITYTDLNDWPGQPATQVSCSAVLKAELVDGREIVLLDDRGWSESALYAEGRGALDQASDQWRGMTEEHVVETARTVVGPDEPADSESYEEAERMHWSYLAGVLERHGVAASPDDLRSLPHFIVLSDRLRRRITGAPPM